jgi:hypothetical protein
MVIGEPGAPNSGKGYVHVYERASTTAPWVYKTQLDSGNCCSADNFGYWFRIYGNIIVGKSFTYISRFLIVF